jgi:hypothetical protein
MFQDSDHPIISHVYEHNRKKKLKCDRKNAAKAQGSEAPAKPPKGTRVNVDLVSEAYMQETANGERKDNVPEVAQDAKGNADVPADGKDKDGALLEDLVHASGHDNDDEVSKGNGEDNVPEAAKDAQGIVDVPADGKGRDGLCLNLCSLKIPIYMKLFREC